MKHLEKAMELDKDLERDIKECKERAEFVEKLLTMLVKGFMPEY